MAATPSTSSILASSTLRGSETRHVTTMASGSTSFAGARLCIKSSRQAVSSRGVCLVVRAEAEAEGQKKEGSGFGLGGPGTWFGFGNRQERNVGRLAMMGFAAALIMEVLTGKGVLGQLGIEPTAVKAPFLAGIIFLFVGGLLGGYVVINNPPDISKAPPNAGDGIPRNPLKTFDAQNLDPLTTYTRGGVVNRPDGQKGREPYASDLDVPKK